MVESARVGELEEVPEARGVEEVKRDGERKGREYQERRKGK